MFTDVSSATNSFMDLCRKFRALLKTPKKNFNSDEVPKNINHFSVTRV